MACCESQPLRKRKEGNNFILLVCQVPSFTPDVCCRLLLPLLPLLQGMFPFVEHPSSEWPQFRNVAQRSRDVDRPED